MKDPRLTDDELDLFVSFAYGGPAYRAGRRAQAQVLNNLFSGKRLDSGLDETSREARRPN